MWLRVDELGGTALISPMLNLPAAADSDSACDRPLGCSLPGLLLTAAGLAAAASGGGDRGAVGAFEAGGGRDLRGVGRVPGPAAATGECGTCCAAGAAAGATSRGAGAASSVGATTNGGTGAAAGSAVEVLAGVSTTVASGGDDGGAASAGAACGAGGVAVSSLSFSWVLIRLSALMPNGVSTHWQVSIRGLLLL